MIQGKICVYIICLNDEIETNENRGLNPLLFFPSWANFSSYKYFCEKTSFVHFLAKIRVVHIVCRATISHTFDKHLLMRTMEQSCVNLGVDVLTSLLIRPREQLWHLPDWRTTHCQLWTFDVCTHLHMLTSCMPTLKSLLHTDSAIIIWRGYLFVLPPLAHRCGITHDHLKFYIGLGATSRFAWSVLYSILK